MQGFIQRHGANVIGTLSGFDRVRLRGTLRWLSNVRGMYGFLQASSVLLKDFTRYAAGWLWAAQPSTAMDARSAVVLLARAHSHPPARLGFLGEAHVGKGLGYIEDDELIAVLYRHRTELRARLQGLPSQPMSDAATSISGSSTLPQTAQPAKEQGRAGEGGAPPPPAKEAQPAAVAAPAEEAQHGWFGKLRTALQKTNTLLNTDIRDLFKREGRLVDDEFLGELFAILVKTDMGTGPALRIKNRIGSDFRARIVHLDDVLKSIKDEIRQILQQPEVPIQFAASGPTVILVVGVNGSGKTTSIAKLAQMFRSQGRKVVLGAGDTFRAAAVEQLTIWADRLGVEIVKAEQGSDPAAVAHRAVARAIETGAEICIIDTAGRLQTQTNLMQQLEKIYRVIGKQIPDAPHETLLVLDATAGQNAISQAHGFSTAAKCTGIVLAKLDGTAKGGVIIPIREKFQIPVKYVGLGEKATDLAVFNADQFADALFADAG